MINFTTCKVEECNSEDQLLTHPSPVRVVAEFDCHPSKRSLRSRGIWASRAKRRVLCGATNPLLSFRGAKATRNLQFSSNSTADPSGSCLRYQPRNSSGLFWSRLEFEGIGGIIGAESNRGSGMKTISNSVLYLDNGRTGDFSRSSEAELRPKLRDCDSDSGGRIHSGFRQDWDLILL